MPAMDATQVMSELEAAGTAQNRKVYARHGYGEAMFGVSFAKLGVLRKRIGTDQELADTLWATGNQDARILACMVAEPGSFDRAKLEAWLGEIDHHTLCGIFASRVAGLHPEARAIAAAWIDDPGEYPSSAGWNIVIDLAMRATGDDDGWFRGLLDRIEATIGSAPNRTRHSMNMALIGIGGSLPALETAALEAADRIGKVEVDHGATGCKTPAAAPYIRRMVDRRQRAAGGGKKRARA